MFCTHSLTLYINELYKRKKHYTFVRFYNSALFFQYFLPSFVGKNNQFAQESEKGQNVLFHSHSGSTANRLGEQYRVTGRTIRRDAKLAKALSSIGEVSPEAKRKILSGEVHINKNRLEALSSADQDEIEAITRFKP